MKLNKFLATKLALTLLAFSSFTALSAPANAADDLLVGVSKSVDSDQVTTYNIRESRTNASSSASSTLKASADELLNRTIIGSDGRSRVTSTTSFPYRAIAYIEISWPDGSTGLGTAWLYSNNRAATAGHCVYDSSHGGWAKSIRVYPGKNASSTPYGYTTVSTMHSVKGWTSSADTNYDYAVLALNSSIGSKTGYFGVHGTTGTVSDTVTVAGYPGGSLKGQLWKMSGTIASKTSYKYFYKIDTQGGQSGSPIYRYNSTNGYQSVGIHTTGSSSTNSGTKITPTIFDWMYSK